MRTISLDGEEQPRHIGPYEIMQVLGKGGMGEVYRARHAEYGVVVALKVMAAELVQDKEALARFQREAASLSAIEHPNIARVYEFGLSAEGAPYLSMEFIEGPSLADLIRNQVDFAHSEESGQPRWSRIARWMREAAEGLRAAYAHKIVHRDIKPANMMLTGKDSLKIVDFGLAKPLFEDSFRTATGTILGTPRYMSPEQGRGLSLDHRSDMYSLGCSFYHLICGQPPFEADTSMALMLKHIQAPVPPLYVARPDCPGDLAGVITRLLAKEPNGRYEDYDALIADLRQVEMARQAKELARMQDFSPAQADPLAATSISPRRGPGEAADLDSHTVLHGAGASPDGMGGFAASAPDSPSGIRRPPPIPAAPPPAKSSTLKIMALIGLVFVLALLLVTAMIQPPDTEGEEKKSGWSILARKLLGKDKGGESQDDSELRKMIETRFALESLYPECQVFEARRGLFPSRLDALVEEGLVEQDDIFDPWGHEYLVFPSQRTLVSLGPDGVEKTDDDFRMISGKRLVEYPQKLRDYDEGIIAREDNKR